MFTSRGYIGVEKSKFNEEDLMSLALDLGADDFRSDDEDYYEILTKPADYEKVKSALEEKKVPLAIAELTFLPQTYIKLSGKDAEQMMAIMEALEEHDDVKNVYSNFDISKQEMEAIEAQQK
jgi:transcriptional/translational regulatory protein YebC/TACO1